MRFLPSSRSTSLHRPWLRGRGLRIALLLACILWCRPAVMAAAGPALRSACELDYPPYCLVKPGGTADGFSVDLLKASLAAVGRDVEFRVGPWHELKQDLAEGRLQVLPLVGRTPERELVFDFTFPYLTMHGAIFARRGDDRMHGPADLADKEILVMKGDNAQEYVLREKLSPHVVAVDTYEGAFRLLAEGKHDAVIGQKLMGLALLSRLNIDNVEVTGAPLRNFRQDFCFAVRKGDSALLALLNEGLSIAVASGELRRLKQKWFAPVETEAGPPRTITVGGDQDYPPYEFLDENGNAAGYNVDLTRAIARTMGFSVRIRLGPWSEVRQELETGRIDAIQGMFYSVERDGVVDFSVPHQVVHHVVFARPDSPPYDSLDGLSGRPVAVMRGDIMHDVAIQHGVTDTLVLTNTQEDAMAALAGGRADFALCARLPGLYWVRKHGWDTVRVVDPHVHCPEYCYAVGRGNARVLSLFEEGLALLKETGEYRRIRDKWLGVVEPVGVPWRTILWVGGTLAAVAVALLLVSLAWSRSLRLQVAAKTGELNAAAAVYDKQARFQAALIEAMPTPVFYKDRDGRYLGCNHAFEELTGKREADIVGKTVYDMGPREVADRYSEKDRELLEHPGTQTYEWQVLTANGAKRDVVFSKATFKDADGHVAGLVGAILDVTERKRAEEAVRDSEEWHRILFDSSRDAIMTLEPPSWRFTSCNAFCVDMFGCADEADFTAHGPWELSPEQQRDGRPSGEKAKEMIEQAMARGSNFFEWMHMRVNGDVFPATVLLTRVEVAGRAFLQATVRDVSDAERARAAVVRAAEEWQETFDAIDACIAIIDTERRVLRANRAMRDAFPGQDVVGAQCYRLVHGMSHAPASCVTCAVFSTGQPAHAEVQEPHLGNRWFDVFAFPIPDATGAVDRVVHVIRDITARREAQTALRQAEKLAAVGKLASGLAHEINNPVMGIINYAQLLKDELASRDKELAEFATEIIGEGDRIARLIRDVRQFAQQEQRPSHTPTHVRDVIETALSELDADLSGRQVIIDIDVPEDLPMVLCSRRQIGQVLTEVLENARDALEERFPEAHENKIIRITARQLPDAESPERASGDRQSAIRITVEDHGAGIPSEHLSRVFEPFYTTKDRSRGYAAVKGTGLGLAMAHNIVTEHDGRLTVESTEGEWTRFHVDLPVA